MEYPLKRRKPRTAGALKRKMHALLGIERTHVRPVDIQKEEGALTSLSLHRGHSRQIKTVLHEVEYKKAKALMEIERQRMRMF